MKQTENSGYLLVNFGGPREEGEIAPFLTALLQDRDVVRTSFPLFFHNWFFGRIAQKRALKAAEDYEKIGGRSPIYFDTEEIARRLQPILGAEVATFHRYLPATHEESLKRIESLEKEEIRVIPLFPQFSYATTGSIARFLAQRLKRETIDRLSWVCSYPGHPAFIRSYQRRVQECLKENGLKEEEVLFLFSAHGLPKTFISTGDVYQAQCEISFRKMMEGFPKGIGRLCYQSKFGRGEWLRPYTDEICADIRKEAMGRKEVMIIPIAFTSDHIETLFEIEEMYLPPIRNQGLGAHRCPALNLEPYWIQALANIAQEPNRVETKQLIRA